MKRLSTKNLDLLPNPSELKKICKSISSLEAIISPEWEYRYYSYQKDWSDTEEFCEMQNGQGDQMLIIFGENGTCINGFAHESQMNGWKMDHLERRESFIDKIFGSKKKANTELTQIIVEGVIDELPKVFNEFIFGEPVKSIGTTFCIWQTRSDNRWQSGEINFPKDEYKDGSSDLLQLLDGNPSTYKNWAESYYEREFELKFIEKIYEGIPITKEIVNKINPRLEDFGKLKSDLKKIGYVSKI